MPRLHDHWTVLPHGPLRAIETGLVTVVGQVPLPLGNFPRRMSVVALPGRRCAIFSPIPLREPDMAAIEALGDPAMIVVPSSAHRLDARPFKARYPNAKVLTATGARAKVEEAVPVDASNADCGERVRLLTVAGTQSGELAMLVKHDGGASLIVNDIIGNVRHPHGPGAWLMSRLMGFGAHGPQVPRVVRHLLIKDKPALAAQLREWADMPGLRRIIPSHGEIIDDQPGAILRMLARSLDGR